MLHIVPLAVTALLNEQSGAKLVQAPAQVFTAQALPLPEPVFCQLPTTCPDCGGRLEDVVDFGCHFLECEHNCASGSCYFTFSITRRAQ